jgi:hypothetical protein
MNKKDKKKKKKKKETKKVLDQTGSYNWGATERSGVEAKPTVGDRGM